MVLLAEHILVFCLKLAWCFIFAEYKITHLHASFECVSSVFTHCLLAYCFKVTTNEQLLEYQKIRKSFLLSTRPSQLGKYNSIGNWFQATCKSLIDTKKIEKILLSFGLA